MPSVWCEHVRLTPTDGSENAEFVRAGNGNNIFNRGQRFIPMMTREGTMRDMIFTVCDVSEALGSVSQMCRVGFRVAFHPHGITLVRTYGMSKQGGDVVRRNECVIRIECTGCTNTQTELEQKQREDTWGFPMTGAILAMQKQRASAVRPTVVDERGLIDFVHGGVDVEEPLDTELADGAAQQAEKSEELAQKYETLEQRVSEEFGEMKEKASDGPPMARKQPPPTGEEWETHRLTHGPYMAGCKHRAAARVARHQHPKKGR